MVTQQMLLAALGKCINADAEQDYLSLKAIHELRIDGCGRVSFSLRLPFPALSQLTTIEQQLTQALLAIVGVTAVAITPTICVHRYALPSGLAPLPGVKNIIAVASAKGGVGKSTTAVNLALALAAEGARVGLLDADIYGPSQSLMLGLQKQKPQSLDGAMMQPLKVAGIEVMSMGCLVDLEQAVIWRGPMVSQALQQLLRQTRWDNVDYLMVDLPPGTGDIQLTLSQKAPLSGAVIVTTPQDIALLDARKGLKMFEKVRVPILGIIENMSIHICAHCGHREAIFGEGGGAKMGADYQLPLLGQLPLLLSIREATDQGMPTVLAQPSSPVAATYRQIARRMAAKLAMRPKDFSAQFKVVVQS